MNGTDSFHVLVEGRSDRIVYKFKDGGVESISVGSALTVVMMMMLISCGGLWLVLSGGRGFFVEKKA